MPMITWRKHTYTNWFFNKNNLVFDKLEEVGLKHKERLDLIRESENNKVLIELGKLLDSGKLNFVIEILLGQYQNGKRMKL